VLDAAGQDNAGYPWAFELLLGTYPVTGVPAFLLAGAKHSADGNRRHLARRSRDE